MFTLGINRREFTKAGATCAEDLRRPDRGLLVASQVFQLATKSPNFQFAFNT